MAATIKIVNDCADDVLPHEEWAPAAGYSGYQPYEVSTYGRVRNTRTGRILKPCLDTHGYLTVCLYTAKNTKYSVRIHRIVSIAFLPNPSEKPEVDHIDNNRQNNNVENLRFCTRQENCRNKGKYKNNKSGFRGVYWHKKNKRWAVQCKDQNGRQVHLGYYSDPITAALAFNVAAVKFHGEFACLNKIPPQCKQQPPSDTDISDTSSIASSSTTTNLSDE
jgi:hypothetical protein